LCQAGTHISGLVTDPQQAPISGASVTLIARDNTSCTKVLTDSSGHFRFEHVAPGAYLVEALAKDFESSAAKGVQVGETGDVQIDFELRLAAIKSTITVTASGTAQTGEELAKAVSVVDGQTLSLRDDNSLAEALQSIPGLRVQQLGGPGALVEIKTRGLRDQDTAVLIDGFRLRDASAPQSDASSLLEDLLVTDVGRIEVLRGAGSSLYGTNASGGVINIITDQGGDRTRASLLAEGGSLATLRGRAEVAGALMHQKMNYSLGVAQLNVLNGVSGKESARTTSLQASFGYDLSASTRIFARVLAASSFSKLTDGPEVIGNVPATGIVDAIPLSQAALTQYEAGTPLTALNVGDATFVPSPADLDFSRRGRLFSGAVKLTTHPTGSVGLTLAYQGLGTERLYQQGPAGVIYPPPGWEWSFYDGEIHTVNGRIDWEAGKHQWIDAGYEFENENYRSHSLIYDPTQNSAVNVTQRSHSIYAQDQLRLLGDRLQLAGSYRVQFFSLQKPLFTPAAGAPFTGTAFSAPPTASTGDGAVAYYFPATGTKIRAHVGRGYRAPSLYERFGAYFYNSSGFSGYGVVGDPLLKPERSISVDTGIDQLLWKNRVQFSATYFYTQLERVIFYDQSQADFIGDPYGRVYAGYLNTKGGLARGVEVGGSASPTRSLDLTAAYTYTNAQERVPLVDDILRTYIIPGNQFSLTASQRFSSRLTVVLGLVASSNYLAPVFDYSNNVSRAYRFAGMKKVQVVGSYRLPLAEHRAIRLFGKAENISDQTYFESGYRTPGATAVGGFELEF
jgi:iron complex outermembrane receptor protein